MNLKYFTSRNNARYLDYPLFFRELVICFNIWNYYINHYVIMNIPRDYGTINGEQMIDILLYDPKKNSFSHQSAETNVIRMILVILCILVLSLGNDVTASFRVDDVLIRFIVNATPVLFSPSRVFLQLCTNYGKIFIFMISMMIVHQEKEKFIAIVAVSI